MNSTLRLNQAAIISKWIKQCKDRYEMIMSVALFIETCRASIKEWDKAHNYGDLEHLEPYMRKQHYIEFECFEDM